MSQFKYISWVFPAIHSCFLKSNLLIPFQFTNFLTAFLCHKKLFPKISSKCKTLPSNFGANEDKYLPLNLKEKSMVNFLENKWLIVLIEKNNSLGFNLDYSLTPSLSNKWVNFCENRSYYTTFLLKWSHGWNYRAVSLRALLPISVVTREDSNPLLLPKQLHGWNQLKKLVKMVYRWLFCTKIDLFVAQSGGD